MAKVRKAKYLYQDGVYYEIGGGGNEDEILARLNNMILVQDDEPTTPYNKIWIKETGTPVEIPEMSDIADFVSFTEDQTARTDAEKAQARANVNAERPWTLVWQNASPTSNFGAQTISLDLSEYKEVCITAPVWASSTDGGCRNYYGFVGSHISLDAYTSERNSGIASYITNRTAKLNSDGVVFSTTTNKPANGTSLNTENDKLIPHRIYAR